MLLSVIVPVYNAEKYLPECLNSLSAAWREGTEIILVDDGSRDSSGHLCDRFQKEHAFVKVVHQPNGGSVAARKRGLAEATGAYITSVDADDWIDADYLEHMLCLLQKHAPDALVTDFTSVCDGKKSVCRNPVAAGFHQFEDMDAIRTQMLCCGENPYQFGITATLWGKCFKKELFERVYEQAPTDVSMGDDAIITYPYLYHAESLYMSEHAGYNYRTNENSMTRTYNAKMVSQCVHLLSYFSKLANEYKGNFGRQTEAYGRFITKHVFMNEFIKSGEGYRRSKEKFMHFLKQDEVMTAMKMRAPFAMPLKDRFFYRCLSWKVIFLPYVFVKMLYQ